MDAQNDACLSTASPAQTPFDRVLEYTGDTANLSMHQLRALVADLSRALDETLRDERANAMVYLRRAADSLRPGRQRESARALNRGPSLIAWKRRRVLEYIEARLGTPLRNRELAALVDLSEFHFNVAFRNSVGASPHEYLVRRRIERARQLMLSTDMTLCDIAAECGLADQAHLSRLFRKVVGETPAAWRKSRVADAGPAPAGTARDRIVVSRAPAAVAAHAM
jgi:AraC-like DNA-binding protein